MLPNLGVKSSLPRWQVQESGAVFHKVMAEVPVPQTMFDLENFVQVHPAA